MEMTVTKNKSSYKLTGVTSEKTYKAVYTAKTYKYVLHLNGGSLDNTSETVEYTIEDISTKSFPIPTKFGHNFVGWFTSPNFKNTASSAPAFGDTDFYAKWAENQYTVTFDYGGKLPENKTVNFTYDQLPITFNVPKADGYEFTGWTYKSDLIFGITKEKFKELEFDENNNITVLANWKESDVSIRNEFYLQNFDGGSYDLVETTTSTATNGTKYEPDERTYTGYKLDTIETKPITQVAPGSVYREYHNLESYTASLHCYEETYGEVVKLGETNEFLYSNHNIELPYMTAKPGFTFVGWKNVSNERVSSIPAYVHENVDYFAYFTQEAPVFGKDFEVKRDGTNSSSIITLKGRVKAKIKGTENSVNDGQVFNVPVELYVYFDGEKSGNVVVMEEAGIYYNMKLYRNAPDFTDTNSLSKPLNIVNKGENEPGSIQANVENLEILEEDGTVIPFIKGSVIKNTLTGIYQLRYAEDEVYYASAWKEYAAVEKGENDATVEISVTKSADYYWTEGTWEIKYSGEDERGNIEYRFGVKNGDNYTFTSYWISTTEKVISVGCLGQTMNVIQARISGNAVYNPSIPVDCAMTQETVNVNFRKGTSGTTNLKTIPYLKNQPFNTDETFINSCENYYKEGYIFKGWYDNNKLTGDVVTVAIKNNQTVYPKFEAKDVNYTINGFRLGLNANVTDSLSQKIGYDKSGLLTKYNTNPNKSTVTKDLTVDILFKKCGREILEQIDSSKSGTKLNDVVLDGLYYDSVNKDYSNVDTISFSDLLPLDKNADGTYTAELTPIFYTIEDDYSTANYVSTLNLVKEESGNILMKFEVPKVFTYYKISRTDELTEFTLDLYSDDYYTPDCKHITNTEGETINIFYVSTDNYNDKCIFTPVYHATRTTGYHTDAENALTFNNNNKLTEESFENVVTVSENGFETKNHWNASEVDETTSGNTTTGTEE